MNTSLDRMLGQALENMSATGDSFCQTVVGRKNRKDNSSETAAPPNQRAADLR